MYCVNCGVELADSERVCPLCGVAAFHPDISRGEGDSLYPTKTILTHKVSPKGALVIVTTAFLIPLLVTLLCDMQINDKVTWSGYVIGALLLSYICVVFPWWFRRPNPVILIPVDCVVLGLFLFYINLATEGTWFLGFALPVVGVFTAIVSAVTSLLRYVKKGKLYIFGGAFLALGVFMPIMELLLNRTFYIEKYLGWAFYPFIALVLLGGMLIFLAIWKPARETMERKFFI